MLHGYRHCDTIRHGDTANIKENRVRIWQGSEAMTLEKGKCVKGGEATPAASSKGGGNEIPKPRSLRTFGPKRSGKGQWTEEEDVTLCRAVQRYKGRNWKKIAECFQSRTDVQCLHRWQNVLNPTHVKGHWSKEEDNKIIQLVKKYGPKKWSSIAGELPGRIGKQCRERWHNYLSPDINREAWTEEEEVVLINAHQIYGNKWAQLTNFLPGRPDNAIKNHWNNSVKKKLESYLATGLLSQFQGLPPDNNLLSQFQGLPPDNNKHETDAHLSVPPQEDNAAHGVVETLWEHSHSTFASGQNPSHEIDQSENVEELDELRRTLKYSRLRLLVNGNQGDTSVCFPSSTTLEKTTFAGNSVAEFEREDNFMISDDYSRGNALEAEVHPFLICDIVSSSELHQEYSPFGIRRLMMQSSNFWDSPSHDDNAANTSGELSSPLKKSVRNQKSVRNHKRVLDFGGCP